MIGTTRALLSSLSLASDSVTDVGSGSGGSFAVASKFFVASAESFVSLLFAGSCVTCGSGAVPRISSTGLLLLAAGSGGSSSRIYYVYAKSSVSLVFAGSGVTYGSGTVPGISSTGSLLLAAGSG